MAENPAVSPYSIAGRDHRGQHPHGPSSWANHQAAPHLLGQGCILGPDLRHSDFSRGKGRSGEHVPYVLWRRAAIHGGRLAERVHFPLDGIPSIRRQPAHASDPAGPVGLLGSARAAAAAAARSTGIPAPRVPHDQCGHATAGHDALAAGTLHRRPGGLWQRHFWRRPRRRLRRRGGGRHELRHHGHSWGLGRGGGIGDFPH
mmetsp:Transcript_4491/g.13447  ORF Transcript_4491/g.13447 Transcript_4491/m.13447 type:complete len:202 (+) Transcript_4491:752-1357(+)